MSNKSEFKKVKTFNSKENITIKKCCYICDHSEWNLSDTDVESAALYCNVKEDANKTVIFYEKICNKFILKKILEPQF
jgi:HD superfamily phosphohydrolase YqeK